MTAVNSCLRGAEVGLIAAAAGAAAVTQAFAQGAPTCFGEQATAIVTGTTPFVGGPVTM
jgi:hypothetical protein